MQKALHVMLAGDLLHEFHRELVVVDGDVGRREHGRKLVLRGRDFVVLGLGEDPVRPERLVEVAHEVGDARFEDAEVMVLQLLSARGGRAEQSTSR